jgi:hypothetical protein
MDSNGTIIFIGATKELMQIIDAYLRGKHSFVNFEKHFQIDSLQSWSDIVLFVMNIDQPWISIDESVRLLKLHPLYENIPVLGMALKQHIGKLGACDRYAFEDIILMPNSWEDMLTRIEVWVKTYQSIKESPVSKVIILESIPNCNSEPEPNIND